MGQFERFFAWVGARGTSLIYYIIETGGKEFTTALMEDALKPLVKKHPALRTTIINR